MKKLLIFGLLIAVAFVSCKKDEDKGDPPKMIDLTIAGDNSSATVFFNEGVYKLDNKSGNLDASTFQVAFSGGTATLASFEVTHVAGEDQAIITIVYTGIASGDEQLTVSPKSATSIYNAKGAAMETSQSVNVYLNELGIIGEWYSSGTNVAFLLSYYFAVDSIYAKFEPNNSYIVKSYDVAGALTTYTGTFTQTKSTVGSIWNITVNQSAPSVATSVGIFEIYPTSPITMFYEVVQTEPPAGTPPTPEAGFGSTNGGALLDWNIQKYIKLN